MRIAEEEGNLPNFDISVLKRILLITEITAHPTREIGAHTPAV